MYGVLLALAAEISAISSSCKAMPDLGQTALLDGRGSKGEIVRCSRRKVLLIESGTGLTAVPNHESV